MIAAKVDEHFYIPRFGLFFWGFSLKLQTSDLSREVMFKVGGVAQLGEHFHGMEGVVGSIPIASTNHY